MQVAEAAMFEEYEVEERRLLPVAPSPPPARPGRVERVGGPPVLLARRVPGPAQAAAVLVGLTLAFEGLRAIRALRARRVRDQVEISVASVHIQIRLPSSDR
jgi:hypothetical protein